MIEKLPRLLVAAPLGAIAAYLLVLGFNAQRAGEFVLPAVGAAYALLAAMVTLAQRSRFVIVIGVLALLLFAVLLPLNMPLS